jgi:putative DNA primase/helicase
VPALNLYDLERARQELRRAAAQQATPASGGSQARIAAALAKDYAGTFAYDLSRQAWMAYDNGLWQPLETERVTQQIMACMDAMLQGDYTWYACAGVEHLLRARLAQTVPLETPGWLPFQNGALCLQTMTLHPHSPERSFTWQLPHAYDPQATCPTTQAWLHEAVGGAHDQVQVLRAYAKAVVTRRVDLQRYLETLGPGGTGKGTYTRLLMALVGCENTCATELKHLEANRFELSQLRGKVLMVITDAERYSGPVNALKAITGQDFVRMEDKFKAQRTEVAPVMVVVAANEPVQSADYTSGLVRRRLSMAFRHRPAVPRDLLSWHAGAWQGALAHEIPGVLNWVLTLPDAQMEALLQQTTTLVPSLQATWASSLVDTNPLAEWANQALLLDAHLDHQGHPLAVVNVGRAHKLDQTNGYAHQDRWLYPHYRAWVDDTGGKPLSSRRFTGLLRDLCENQLRLDGVEHRDDNKGSRFFGIRLRTPSDVEAPLLITNHPPPMTDGTPPVTAESRVRDGCDACDGFVQGLAGPLSLLSPSGSPLQGEGVLLSNVCNHLSKTSHPSLVRGSGVTAPVLPVTEALVEETLGVGAWVWLLLEDGVHQNVRPYQIRAIARGHDGQV